MILEGLPNFGGGFEHPKPPLSVRHWWKPSSGSRVVPCRQTLRHDKAYSCFL